MFLFDLAVGVANVICFLMTLAFFIALTVVPFALVFELLTGTPLF